ncbi:MAG: O-antigen ligase family protein, partial [Beijerinckiaceae bacterium]
MLCVVSISWSHAPAASARQFVEFLVPTCFGVVAVLCFPLIAPGRRAIWWCGAAALTGIVIAADIKFGLVLREVTGGRVQAYSYNRGIVLLCVLLWPLLALAIAEGRRSLIICIVPIVAAVAMGESATAWLALIVGCLVFPVALLLPRLGRWIGLALVLLLLAISPFAGTIASRTMGVAVDAAMPSAHAGDRIAIWQSFEAAAQQRIWFGNGFGSSLNL